MRKLSFIAAFIISISISSVVIVSGHGGASVRCSLDGSLIQPAYEVIINHKNGSVSSFSSVISARIWLTANSELVSSILVTDEETGDKLNAESAFYVESEVLTTLHTRNNIHVFAQEKAAKSHARKFKGKMITNPFRVQKKKPCLRLECGTGSANSPDFVFSPSQKPIVLPSDSVLIKKENSSYLSQNYSTQLPKGYLSPPYKPPKKII